MSYLSFFKNTFHVFRIKANIRNYATSFLLLSIFFNLFFINPVFCQETGKILAYGKAVDSMNDQPISNATILLWDTSYYRKIGTALTNETGDFAIEFPFLEDHTYQIFVYRHLSGLIYDYVPLYSDKFMPIAPNEKFNFNFRMYPAATIYLNGTINYIG